MGRASRGRKKKGAWCSAALWTVGPLIALAIAYLESSAFRVDAAAQSQTSQKEAASAPSADERCVGWANAGECTRNPGYMGVHCKRECEGALATLSAYDARCPVRGERAPAIGEGDLHAFMRGIVARFPELEPELVHADPPILVLHKFLLDDEIAAYVRHGIGRYNPSMTVGTREDGTIGDVPNRARTSEHAWCDQSDCLHDPAVQRATDRLARMLEVPATHFEYAQLVYYRQCTPDADNCAFYKPHSDFIASMSSRLPGPRVYTLFAYLNDVEEGGETRFTKLDPPLTIKATRGKAVLWPSVQNDDPFVEDDRLTHEALPVHRGEKFGANFWVHMYDFRTPHAQGCS